MADDPKVPSPPEVVPSIEEWSGISPGDLGLKAVYWTDDTCTAIVSRPIVGWITYAGRRLTDVLTNRGFAAIVIADFWVPVLAGAVPRFVGIAPKDKSDEEIIARMREWGAGGGSPQPQGIN